jgi:hypothetical protein
MTREINYKQTTTFLGRNGVFKQNGLIITEMGDEIVLFTSYTNKNLIGRAFICVPKSDIPELIKELNLIPH